MSDHNWCHGPECHERHTQDRVRGVKGSKVLRTRKIKQTQWTRGAWGFFCSQGCYNDFFHKYVNELIAIAPRTEALETPVNVSNEHYESYWGNGVRTKIEVDETRQT